MTEPNEPAPVAVPLLLDARAAAQLAGVGRTLWLQLVSSGRAPAPIRLGERRILWRRDILERWIALNCPSQDRFEILTRGQG